MSAAPTVETPGRRPFLVPTVTKQCWGFMVGSAFFALGSAPGLGDILGSNGANILFFIGAWFFTAAGLMQWFLSGPVSVEVPYPPGRMVRADWLTAASQSFGTIMFNISTSAALYVKTTHAQLHYVWNPDAGGSVLFLVSGFFAFVAYRRVARGWDFGKWAWWSVLINFIGCVAFGLSAVGAYVLPGGKSYDGSLANGGTFIGALCFLVASLIVLPFWTRRRDARSSGTVAPADA